MLAVYLLFSVACFFTVYEHLLQSYLCHYPPVNLEKEYITDPSPIRPTGTAQFRHIKSRFRHAMARYPLLSTKISKHAFLTNINMRLFNSNSSAQRSAVCGRMGAESNFDIEHGHGGGFRQFMRRCFSPLALLRSARKIRKSFPKFALL